MTTHATDSIHIEGVDSTGDSSGYTVTPAGASSPAIGATGWTMDGLSADGGLTMARTQPANMDNVDLGGPIQLSGTAPSSDMVAGSTISAEGITINGCGWKVDMRDVTIGSGGSNGAWISANCASSASSNVVTVADGTMSGSSSNNNYAYARNSVLTVAEMTMTGMTAWGSYVASAGTNGDIRLIDVNFDGNDCLDSATALTPRPAGLKQHPVPPRFTSVALELCPFTGPVAVVTLSSRTTMLQHRFTTALEQSCSKSEPARRMHLVQPAFG